MQLVVKYKKLKISIETKARNVSTYFDLFIQFAN